MNASANMRCCGRSAPRSRLIRGALGAEFALLGCFGGLLAAFGAEATVFALDKHVFELPAHLHGWVWFVGPAVGAAIVCGIGLLGTRTLIASPPMLVLRGIG